MSKTILVVDDEPDALELIGFNLRANGYNVVAAADGEEALRKAREVLPSLIILDVMLPGSSGLEICKLLKREPATGRIPIMMVTARAAEIDRVVALELGADDYVTKPFSTRELVLRVRGLLSRAEKSNEKEAEHLAIHELQIDVTRHRVLVEGREIVLTATEFKLLLVLAQRRGRVQSREQLLRDVWSYESMVDTRTVDTHMRRVRGKLGNAARHLDTVRGVGYRFLE